MVEEQVTPEQERPLTAKDLLLRIEAQVQEAEQRYLGALDSADKSTDDLASRASQIAGAITDHERFLRIRNVIIRRSMGVNPTAQTIRFGILDNLGNWMDWYANKNQINRVVVILTEL